MVPLTPLSTIDTWREESRAQLAQRGADIKGAEAQRARRQGIKEGITQLSWQLSSR